jgi:hypothetical protein
MNPYSAASYKTGTTEAVSLAARLAAWHDAMVAHERRLRADAAADRCDDECPHVEARALWAEALSTFGAEAHELTFLRSHGHEATRRTNARMPSRRAPMQQLRTG